MQAPKTKQNIPEPKEAQIASLHQDWRLALYYLFHTLGKMKGDMRQRFMKNVLQFSDKLTVKSYTFCQLG